MGLAGLLVGLAVAGAGSIASDDSDALASSRAEVAELRGELSDAVDEAEDLRSDNSSLQSTVASFEGQASLSEGSPQNLEIYGPDAQSQKPDHVRILVIDASCD